MNHEEMLQLFQELGVFARGHFLLSSGRHSDEYWEKFRVFEHPRVTEQLCGLITQRYREQNVAVVIGPTTGGGPAGPGGWTSAWCALYDRGISGQWWTRTEAWLCPTAR